MLEKYSGLIYKALHHIPKLSGLKTLGISLYLEVKTANNHLGIQLIFILILENQSTQNITHILSSYL
jgi:hypothetical protein